MAKLVPLFSGSKGNSYYIGSGDEGILIDAGRNCKQLETALSLNNIDIKAVKAVFVTHEHTDHCAALKVFLKKYGLPVYASNGTVQALIDGCKICPNANLSVIENSVAVGDMLVKCFKTPHDAAESLGFCITTKEGSKAVVATDMGYMTSEARNLINTAKIAVIESNHDVNMLRNGNYPYILKRRILSKTGHLSNDDCAKELDSFVENGVTHFVLAHLSEENNYPALALQTSLCQLELAGKKIGVDFELTVAPAQTTGKVIAF